MHVARACHDGHGITVGIDVACMYASEHGQSLGGGYKGEYVCYVLELSWRVMTGVQG